MNGILLLDEVQRQRGGEMLEVHTRHLLAITGVAGREGRNVGYTSSFSILKGESYLSQLHKSER